MLNKIFVKIEKFIPVRFRWILSHEGFKRYFSNTGWMFLGQVFSLLVSFFIGAWIARYLGPENYGILSYSVAFVGLFGFISSLGVDGILNRELVRFPKKRDELLGTALRLKLIGGGIAFSLTVIGAFLFQTDALIRLLISLFSFTFILQAINVISTYFQAEIKSKNNVKATLIATLISSTLKIAIILSGQGVIWIIVVYLLDSVFQGIGFVRVYNRCKLKISKWKFNINLAKDILKDSWPLMLAAAASYIYARIDQVMIGSLLGNREVGLYAIAVKLVEIWYFIPGILCASLFPAIINAKKSSIELYQQRLKNFYVLMMIVSILISVVLTFLAKPLVYFLFGIKYLEAIVILYIYTWSCIGLFLGMAVYQYLMAENKVKIIFIINIITMIINIILNFIFILKFGLIGAAWATLISYSIFPLSFFLWIRFVKSGKLLYSL